MKHRLGTKTLIQPSPVWVIGTYDADGRPNAMTASWTGICCSKPPAVNVSLREATFTYHNVIARQAFTVGVPSADQAKLADYLGIASGRDTDKIAAAGLTPVRADTVDAPRMEEFALTLECRLIHRVNIGLHTLFVGEICEVVADDTILGENDRPLVDKLHPFIYAVGEGTYRSLGGAIGEAFTIGKTLQS